VGPPTPTTGSTWVAEANRPPPGRLPPPKRKCHPRRFLPASSAAPPRRPPSPRDRREPRRALAPGADRVTSPRTKPAPTFDAHPPQPRGISGRRQVHPHRRRLPGLEQPPCHLESSRNKPFPATSPWRTALSRPASPPSIPGRGAREWLSGSAWLRGAKVAAFVKLGRTQASNTQVLVRLGWTQKTNTEMFARLGRRRRWELPNARAVGSDPKSELPNARAGGSDPKSELPNARAVGSDPKSELPNARAVGSDPKFEGWETGAGWTLERLPLPSMAAPFVLAPLHATGTRA